MMYFEGRRHRVVDEERGAFVIAERAALTDVNALGRGQLSPNFWHTTILFFPEVNFLWTKLLTLQPRAFVLSL